MWGKRKRMELVRFSDRRKYRSEERSPDEIMLTRRMFVMKGMVVTGFGALAGKLWQMQLVESAEHQTRAEGNLLDDEPIPAPRGMILDRNDEVLAENRVTWRVEMIPARLPSDEDEFAYVREQVIKTLELRDMLAIRRHSVPNEINGDLAIRIAEETGIALEDIEQHIDSAHESDNVIPILTDLDPIDADRLSEAVRSIPGVAVINQFDYIVQSNPVSANRTLLRDDLDREIALALEANQVYLPGIRVDGEALTRRYPGGESFCHILGYVGPITEEEFETSEALSGQSPYLPTDLVGRGGLEQALETDLRGRRGVRFVQTDVRGITISELEDRRIEAEPGRNVHLTIDRRFQEAVTRALREGIEFANEAALEDDRDEVRSGIVVAMDPRSGEILALVSLPNYDNQMFVDGIPQEEYDKLIEDPLNPLTNKAISGAYPPGSTIKPLLSCAGLEEGTITQDTEYYCAGSIEVPTVGLDTEHNTYVCWWRDGHGSLDVEGAISQSCNIFFYNVGAPYQVPEGSDEALHYFLPNDQTPHYFEGLGIDMIGEYLRNEFGLGQPTGIELANETEGVVPDPEWLFQSPLREYWSVGDTINVSIGQGHLSASPLQITSAIAAIANRGTLYRPRLVRGFGGGVDGEYEPVSPEVLRELRISQENLEIVRSGMLGTITMGTAADKFPRTGDGIQIAGKTGTADFGEEIDGSYGTQHASFCAFAPFDNPEIAVTVLIPGGGEGSTYAVPVADAVLAYYFGREPMEPQEDEDAENDENEENDEGNPPEDNGDIDDGGEFPEDAGEDDAPDDAESTDDPVV
ncbi:MAG: penicillin-binding protein 2 [Thermomicrobiaceae bacterium]